MLLWKARSVRNFRQGDSSGCDGGHQGYATSLIHVNVASSKMDRNPHSKYSGTVQLVWKAPNFADTVQKLFSPGNDWSFYEDPTAPGNKSTVVRNEKEVVEADSLKLAQLLPYFVLVKFDNWHSRGGGPSFMSNTTLSVGDSLYAVGTPFANLSPQVFLNSTSQGIVCQVAGKKKETILTDARCIPGSEGGAIYLQDRY